METPTRTADRAEALLADAFGRRYRYCGPAEGWTAHARCRDATGEFDATVAVSCARDAQAIPDVDIATPRLEWVVQDLRSFARTLYGHDYEKGEGRFPKVLDDTPNPLGPLVVLLDDPHRATFRVRKHRITEATRIEGELRQRLRVDRWHVRPDGRWLPAQWKLEIWAGDSGRRLVCERYWDLYWPVQGELVPQLRRVDITDEYGLTSQRSLSIGSWQLLNRP